MSFTNPDVPGFIAPSSDFIGKRKQQSLENHHRPKNLLMKFCCEGMLISDAGATPTLLMSTVRVIVLKIHYIKVMWSYTCLVDVWIHVPMHLKF